jgi:hypothetical protein
VNGPDHVHGRKGVAGITPEHRRAWEEGQISYRSIAKELGIAKQTVAAFAKRNSWTRKQPKKEDPAPVTPTPAERSKPSALQITEDDAERDYLILVQSHRVLLTQTLQSMKNPMDAIGRQRVVMTLKAIREELWNLGYLQIGLEQKVPELVIRVLTPEEEIEIQRKANGENEDQATPSDSAGALQRHEEETAIPEARRSLNEMATNGNHPGNSSGGSLGNSGGGSPGNSDPQTTRGHVRTSFTLPRNMSLPDPSAFRTWLEALAHKFGNVTLCQLTGALTGDEPPPEQYRDRPFLIARILTITGANPERLRHLLPPEAA